MGREKHRFVRPLCCVRDVDKAGEEHLNCSECQSNRLNIYDSRHVFDYVIRKRKCLSCDHRFYTVETYLTEEELLDIEAMKKEAK